MMISRRNMHSEYLSDQGKRTHLLDYLASMYECIADLSGVLLTLEHGRLDEAETDSTKCSACTHVMNLLGDMRMIYPMLLDIYHEDDPVVDG